MLHMKLQNTSKIIHPVEKLHGVCKITHCVQNYTLFVKLHTLDAYEIIHRV